MDGDNPFEPCQRTWFWTLAAHGRLDQERQSKDSRGMHGIMALRRNFAVVISFSHYPISNSTTMIYQG